MSNQSVVININSGYLLLLLSNNNVIINDNS